MSSKAIKRIRKYSAMVSSSPGFKTIEEFKAYKKMNWLERTKYNREMKGMI